MSGGGNVQPPTLNAQRPSGSGDRFDLDERLLDYAADIIRLTEKLPRTMAATHVAGQMLHSGTSALPNHGEAQAAESPADFIHKLSICLQEQRESRRWQRLTRRVPLVAKPDTVTPLLTETEELSRIFYRSIQTARKNSTKGGAPNER
ncbi:MAG: four helix bundle protein [Verrucomicrobiota bacterium]